MTDDEALFTLPAAMPVPELSADARRTRRHLEQLTAGWHPLGTHAPLRLHPDAAPAGDRAAPGLRCGTCRWRDAHPTGYRGSAYPKCWFGWDGHPGHAPLRITHGPGTDVRAWWPACTDYAPADDEGGA